MIFKQINPGACKTYLLASDKTREAVLVDPLLEKVDEHLRALKAEGLRLAFVIDTHTHADHLSGCTALRDAAGVPYVMHADTRVASVTRKVQDGEVLGVGDLSVSFVHTPGHTRDSVSLLMGDRMLSGDFLFIGSYGAGRLDLPGADPGTHFDSLKRIDGLSDSLLLMPAHDYQGLSQSTLGAEREKNPVLSPRGREAYVRWWLDRKQAPADWMARMVSANLSGTKDPGAARAPKDGAACACAPSVSDGEEMPHIAAKDLAAKIRQSPGSVALLDVRTPEEFDDELGHIAGAVLIPIDELSDRTAEVPKGPVAVICRSGKRALRAGLMLRQAGREEVWVLTGGMLAWNEAGLPIARRAWQ